MDLYFLNSPQAMAIFMVIAILWTLPWKAVALWKAARNKQLYWFIAILIVNSLAILEIIYLFFFQKKTITAKNKRR